ncbi:MAG: TolC family protein [Candidatus Desulforudaceae bacterium]
MRKVLGTMLCTVFMLGLLVSAAWTKEPATPELTLNQAIARAIQHSMALKVAGLGVDKAGEHREYASDQLTFTPVVGGSYDPRLEAAWYSLLSADLGWQMSKRSQNTEEDRLVLSTCQKYWDVLRAEEKVQVAELSLRKADLGLRKTRAQVQAGLSSPGMSPQLALQTAEMALAGAKAGRVSAQNDLDLAFATLNQSIGLWPEDRPLLVDTVEFKPVEVHNLEAYIQRVLETSPNIWLAEEGVTMAKYAQELMWASGQYTPYEIRKIEVKEAEYSALSARDAVKLGTRELYYGLRGLEEAYITAEKGLETAEEALRVVWLMKELGMVTTVDVAEREAALAEAKQGLLDLACQHAYMKLAFQKPWAMTR